MATPTEQARKIWAWIIDETSPQFCIRLFDNETSVRRCADWFYKHIEDKGNLLFYRDRWRKLYNLFSNNAIDGTFVWEMLTTPIVYSVLVDVLTKSKDSQKESDANIYATMLEMLRYMEDIITAFIRAALRDNKRQIQLADWELCEHGFCNTKTEELIYLDDNLDFRVCIGNLPAASTDAAHNEPQQVDATAEANTHIVGGKVGAVISDDTASVSKPQQAQQPVGEPQQGKNKRGRPTKKFRDLLTVNDKNAAMQKLHHLLDGRKGKEFALIILACVLEGKMQKPTYSQTKNEFGDIGSATGFLKYLTEQRHAPEEVEGARRLIQNL